MSTDGYRKALGARLRAIRTQRMMSLGDVERESRGVWPAVTISSWERGDRRPTVERLARYAAFHELPVSAFIPETRSDGTDRPGVLDEFPGEMDLCQDSYGRWVLVLSAPELQGTVVSTSQEFVMAVAEAYAAMRRDQIRSAA